MIGVVPLDTSRSALRRRQARRLGLAAPEISKGPSDEDVIRAFLSKLAGRPPEWDDLILIASHEHDVSAPVVRAAPDGDELQWPLSEIEAVKRAALAVSRATGKRRVSVVGRAVGAIRRDLSELVSGSLRRASAPRVAAAFGIVGAIALAIFWRRHA